MKLLSFALSILVLLGASNQALAGKKKKSHRPSPLADEPSLTSGASKDKTAGTAEQGTSNDKTADGKQPLDFDFFGDKPAGSEKSDLEALDRERQSQTRRWMLTTHQTLGITTWALMAATVTVGQLNYNQLYQDGGGSTKWQPPHRILVLSTSLAFAATAAFAIFAPTPYEKPLRFDTGLIHRIAVIGATVGMVAEGLLGWYSARQAEAGNPNKLGGMVMAHQIIGYTTFGFLTVAGAVWVF